MLGTRTYYCEQCKKCVEFKREDTTECKCGKIFGVTGNLSDYINMRKTLSGTTKMEFNTTTVEESVKKMNASK